MRAVPSTVRLLVTATLTASVLAVPAIALAPSAGAAAPTPPYNVLTVSGEAGGIDHDATVTHFDQSALGPPNESVTLSGSQPSLDDVSAGIIIAPANGQSLTTGTFDVAPGSASPPTGKVGVGVGSTNTGYPETCQVTGGSISISELGTDADTGAITALAADYRVTCSSDTALSGSLRFNSEQSYAAVATDPDSWDFGDVDSGGTGIAKTMTFTNDGSVAVTWGAVSLTNPSAAANYQLSADTCSGGTIAPGSSCSIHVTPRPVNGVSAAICHLVLPSMTTGLRSRILRLSYDQSTSPTVEADGGPGFTTFNWQRLPAQDGLQVSSYQVYRGADPSALTAIATESADTHAYRDTTAVPGTTYYYAVAPVFSTGTGDRTPAVAAIAWPAYSAGVYHRLSAPTRFRNHVTVTTGHPYSLPIEGHGGVPGSGVSAIAMNLYASSTTAGVTTKVTAWPSGAARPAEANVAVTPGHPHTNFGLVQLGSGGAITISVDHGSVPVTVDVAGWYTSDANSSHGQGGTSHTYLKPGVLLDTRSQGALAHGYYYDIPVDFTAADTPHVTSLAVQVTAFGSSGAGTLTTWATGNPLPATTAIAYTANSTTSNYQVVPAGRFTASNGRSYPSISVLNSGSKPVQVIVQILGFYDDNTFAEGERYYPTTPVRLKTPSPIGQRQIAVVDPGAIAGEQTHALNLQVSVGSPSATTGVGLWPQYPGVGSPPQVQLRADAHATTFAQTVEAVGNANKFLVENSTGTTTLSVWSFGHFEAYPVPTARTYDATPAAAPRAALLLPARRLS